MSLYAGDITSERSQASLSEQVRAGGLRPMLELGVTPSHLSMAVEEKEEEEGGGGGGGAEEEEEKSYCVPLESLGLGGNQITDAGAKSLAAGLQSNTSEHSYTVSSTGAQVSTCTSLTPVSSTAMVCPDETMPW